MIEAHGILLPAPPGNSSYADFDVQLPSSAVDLSSNIQSPGDIDNADCHQIWHTSRGKTALYIGQAHRMVYEANSRLGSSALGHFGLQTDGNYYRLLAGAAQLYDLAQRHCTSEDVGTRIHLCITLCQLFATEFNDMNKAEFYANEAIKLSETSPAMEVAQYSLANVLTKTASHTFVVRHLSELEGSGLIELLRVQVLLLRPSTCKSGLIKLTKWKSSKLADYGAILRASYLLTQCQPNKVYEQLSLIRPNVNQLVAMRYLTMYLTAIRLRDTAVISRYTRKLNQFIIAQQESHWHGWRQDGVFTINLDEINLKVYWLSPTDLIATFYVLTGLAYLCGHNSPKLKKFLEKAITTCEKQPSSKMSERIRRTAKVYMVWAHFVQGDFSESTLTYLKDEITRFNEGAFSDPGFETTTQYLYGVFHLAQGNWDRATHFFGKVEVKPTTFDMGHFGELRLYSKMNLLILSTLAFEHSLRISKSDDGRRIGLDSHQLKDFLVRSIAERPVAFTVLEWTLEILQGSLDSGFTDLANLESAVQRGSFKLNQNVMKIVSLLVYSRTDNSEIRQSCFLLLAELSLLGNSEVDKRLNILILRALMERYKDTGDHDKANMAILQIKYYEKALQV